MFGVFADGQFGSLKGSIQDLGLGITGSEKMKDAWAAGARLGYLVAPNVLSYVNAGYTGTYWSGSTLLVGVNWPPVRTPHQQLQPQRLRSSAAASRTT